MAIVVVAMTDVSETRTAIVRICKIKCDICGEIVENDGHPVFCRRKCDLCGKDLCDSAKCGETAMYDDGDGDLVALRFCIPCLEGRKSEVETMLRAVGLIG